MTTSSIERVDHGGPPGLPPGPTRIPVSTDGTDARPHGSRARYVVDRCRCPDCRAANAAYARSRGPGPGKVGPFVPALLARSHLRRLADAGLGTRAASEASGVPRSTLQAVLDGTQTKLRESTERRILALSACDRLPGAYVPAGPTLARIEELLEADFSRGWVSRQLGGARIRGDKVTVATAAAVQALADAVLARPDRPDPDEILAAHTRMAHTIGLLGQDWRVQGACYGSGLEFVEAARAALEEAKAICARCSVRQPCLELALETGDEGIWGGTDAEERRAIRAGRSRDLALVDGGGQAA